VEAFADGAELLEEGDRLELEGVVSKRKASPYRSGECRDWRKIKTRTWREANRERWRLFENGANDSTPSSTSSLDHAAFLPISTQMRRRRFA